MKSIAAFSNGEGGTLLIGVNDEGEILGLEHDYSSLNGTKDEFGLHLRSLENKSFGGSFAACNSERPDSSGIGDGAIKKWQLHSH